MIKKQAPYRQRPARAVSTDSSIHLFFLGLLSVSFMGYFLFRNAGVKYVFGHAAGLSIMGFYGGLAGVLLKAKGYGYNLGFRIGFFVPIILGGVSAFVLAPYGDNPGWITCGGWTSLASGLLVVVALAMIKKKKPPQENAG